MILVDTSAWVEFLRGTGSPVCDAVDVRADVEVLHADADFETLARRTDLRTHRRSRR